VSHPQVYEVYHGAPPALGAYSPADAVERCARSGRLWLVCTVTSGRGALTAPGVVARVEAAGVALARRRFKGVEVILFAPAAGRGTPSASEGGVPVSRPPPPPNVSAAHGPAPRPAAQFSGPRAAPEGAQAGGEKTLRFPALSPRSRFAGPRHIIR
jgi:hypothetical protein